MAVSIMEIILILAVVIALCIYLPYCYSLAVLAQCGCIIHIVASDDNPDYKVPWLLVVLVLPVIGFMLYFMFYSRKLKGKQIRRINQLKPLAYQREDKELFDALKKENLVASNQARMIKNLSYSHLFTNTSLQYFSSGEGVYDKFLQDLKSAKTFIFIEYFIIQKGKFWDSVLDVLKVKVKEGVDVRVVYDDIGCMTTLPGNYSKRLNLLAIKTVAFSRLRGSANGEFNNRNHRKITVIDGVIGYTGGINLADEYINEVERFGYWKDNVIRLEGEAVWEFSKLFVCDFGINSKEKPNYPYELYPQIKRNDGGYLVPFGDAPNPLYTNRVGKSVIQNLLASATKYVYITTPYLVVDNDLCQDIEVAALRGVDVRIILPGIPDKKFVFEISRSFYNRLIKAGVKIYEYKDGFIHSKTYLVDGEYAMVGSINLDYRSLVHHFENAVWMYKCECIKDIEKDVLETLEDSVEINENMLKMGVVRRFYRSLLRLFAPLM
jgi:cardiolipin synthase